MLSPSHRKGGIKIVLLLCLGSLLDFFSLAFFLPVILLVINPEHAFQNKYVLIIYKFSGFSNHSSFAVSITLGVIIFLFIKTQVSSWIIHYKASYAYQIANDFGSLTLTHYLYNDYLQFTSADFSKQSNRITNLPLTFANNIIIPSGTILSESIISLLLLTGIVIFDANVFIFIVIIFIPLAVIYFFQKKKLKNISQKIKKAYPLLLKYTMQAVEGWIEIKSFHKEDYFRSKFLNQYKELTTTFSKAHIANTSPARITELIAATCVGSLILYSIWSNQPYHHTLLLLSIYAGVSFRIIPSINRIFAALLQMRSHEYVVHELSKVLIPSSDISKTENKSLLFNEEIQFSKIFFSYETQPFLLQNISLSIRKGERIAITGRSGSGKTSLLLLLLRFIKETKGEIYVDHIPLKEENTTAWQKLISYVPQNPYILDGSIAENIAFGLSNDQIDFVKVEQVSEQAELRNWINVLPEKINTILGEKGAKISGGQRQRIAIARALYKDSEILLLDEITNQLDASTEAEVIHTILKVLNQQKTIIMVTHREELWKQFDVVYEMKDGKLDKKII